MRRFALVVALAAVGVTILVSPNIALAQQSDDSVPVPIPIDVSISPFVSFIPTGSAIPMTGLALSLTGGPFALRAGGNISLLERNTLPSSTAVAMRPWGADADVVAFLESLSYGNRIALSPYVFTGVSIAAMDVDSQRVTQHGWSYGAGLGLPFGSSIAAFGEWRWRMSRFVLPESRNAPAPTSEVRIGLAFHVGGGHGAGAVPVSSSEDDDWVSLAGSPSTSTPASRVLSTAEQYIGTPYRRGGTSPSTGFDASGFVRFVFSRFGVVLPRTSRDQARVGERVRTDWRSIAPGDLLMFKDDGGINHVAIYVGRGRIIHSSETGGGVRFDDLSTDRGRWFADHLVAARRVTPDLRGLLLDLARGYDADVSGNVDGPDHAPRASGPRKYR